MKTSIGWVWTKTSSRIHHTLIKQYVVISLPILLPSAESIVNLTFTSTYPQRVREAMAIAVAMGSTTIRALTLGVSTGNSLSVEPSLNNFNAKAFDAIDYALFAAREYGLRVIITLTDDYDYYHGGKCVIRLSIYFG